MKIRFLIYSVIAGCFCLALFHARVELVMVQEEKAEALELERGLDRTLNERQWYSWKPPFGRRGLYKTISQSGYRIWGVRHDQTDLGGGTITNVPEDEIEWGFGKGAWATKDFIRVDKHSKVILSDESIKRIAGGCSQLIEDKLRVAVTRHPVWDGVVDGMHTGPPYSRDYEAGFDAAFNMALGTIQEWR